jgi:predicted AAA+ superfamily ATPase
MIPRPGIVTAMTAALERSPAVVLSGPRQCGKTTLARQLLSPDSLNYFDLEDPAILRVLVDRTPNPARFLILGSASGDLLRQTSESLAGRSERLIISGFSLDEVGGSALQDLWRRGSFPLSYLAGTETDSVSWRDQFILALLERDLPQWGVRVPATALRRFWTVIAHYHGQTWNAADAARTLGVSSSAVRHYLDLLTDAFMVRQLQPWHANLRKRQVKSPKVYVRDSGLLHRLLGIDTPKALMTHPKVGASWEGFVIEQVLAAEQHDEAFFWGTHQGAEIDLILSRGGRLLGVECKRTDAPRMTKSIGVALADLDLDRVAVVYPGERRYPLAERVEAVPVSALAEREGLFGED